MAPEPKRRAAGAAGLRPPRLAEVLLRLSLPPGGIRESVLGDLHEMFVHRASDPSVGRMRARGWYRVRAFRLSLMYLRRRLGGGRFRGFDPAPRVSRPSEGGQLSGLWRELRLAVRSLTRNPGFTLPVLAILAVGMTAATAIFTVVDSIVFRPLELHEPHRIVIVCEDHPGLRGACLASPATTEDFRSGTSTLDDLGWGRAWPFHLTDDEGSDGVRGGLATAAFFRALGVRPALGRLFSDDEVGPGHDDLVVLSHAFWTARYGGDRRVLGEVVRLDGEPYEVVGVLPESFEAPFDLEGIQLWKPPHVDLSDPSLRGWRGWRAIGRLGPGATVAAAEAELTSIYTGLSSEHDEIDDTWRLRVGPLQRVVVGDSRMVLLAFLGGAGLLLVIVCANVANLVLARGLARRSELAVRAALGAARGRLVRVILGEGLILAVAASVIAVLLSSAASRALVAFAPPDIPRLDEVATDGRVIIFAALATIAVTAACGLLPALRATAGNPGQALKSGSRGGEERGSGSLRSAHCSSRSWRSRWCCSPRPGSSRGASRGTSTGTPASTTRLWWP